jgi:transposase
MRGMDERSGLLFSYVDLERRVPDSHPLRAIRLIVNEALSVLTARFEALYSPFGRPSIPPEQLLRAMLLQAFYSIRSERQLMERLDFDLSFRWFVGLGIDDAVWDHSIFSKNRDRLLDGDVAAGFLCAVLERPKVKRAAMSTSLGIMSGRITSASLGYSRWDAATNEVEYLRIGAGSHLDYQVHITLNVMFEGINAIAGKLVIPTLGLMAAETERVVTEIEAEARRIGRVT